jgi:multiple sugar transport system permease protein
MTVANLDTPGNRIGSLRRGKIIGAIATYTILLIVVALILFPLYWMIITSLKLPKEIYRLPSLWPKIFTSSNYHTLIYKDHFMRNIKNSLFVALTVTIISLFVSSFAAYSVVRFKYRFKGLIGRVILFAYLTPTSLLYGLIVVYLTFSLPLSTWLLQGYFRAVPRELEEQAMVDGSTRMGALFKIVIPLSAPGLSAVAIFTFTGAWNELLLALIFITSESKRTVPLGINYLITSDVLPWGTLMAGAVISSAPVIILYFLAQRFMVGGATSGSVKG